jgi:hypothetical protein
MPRAAARLPGDRQLVTKESRAVPPRQTRFDKRRARGVI